MYKLVKGNIERIADTDEKRKMYISQGYTEIDEEKTLDKMIVEELKAYAAENSIDLGDKTRKADILALIQEAEKN